MHAWVEKFAGAVIVSDRDGIILELNARAAANYAKEGGLQLIGQNMLDCHPEPARSKLRTLMENQTTNVYTIEKKGLKKLIYQAPWYAADGSYAGFIELSMEIPAQMPHFVRRSPPGAARRETSLEPAVVRPEPPAAQGWVLDVGGGGEGVIGRLLGSQVVAIDLLDEELRDTPPGPLKVRMDARSLQFQEGSFALVTVFYLFLFTASADQGRILAEIARVLKPGGVCCVWDTTIPDNPQAGAEDVLLIPLNIELPGETLTTCYGVPWQGRSQSPEGLRELAKAAGLQVEAEERSATSFFFQFRKP